MGNKFTDILIATGKGTVTSFLGGGIIADKRMNEWQVMVEDL